MEKSELYRKAITGSFDELRIFGDWYVAMEVFGLDYESAGELTVGQISKLIAGHENEFSALWKKLTIEWKHQHTFA